MPRATRRSRATIPLSRSWFLEPRMFNQAPVCYACITSTDFAEWNGLKGRLSRWLTCRLFATRGS